MTIRRALILGCWLLACDPGAPGSFPPEDPTLAAENQAAGDPHRGRFPFADSVAGLPEAGQLHAAIISDAGVIHCRLHADVAPLAVANFVGLARGLRPFLDPVSNSWTTRPYYDGLSFHRAQERQFVQGGRLGETGWIGFRLQDEPSVGSAFNPKSAASRPTASRPPYGRFGFRPPLRSGLIDPACSRSATKAGRTPARASSSSPPRFCASSTGTTRSSGTATIR